MIGQTASLSVALVAALVMPPASNMGGDRIAILQQSHRLDRGFEEKKFSAWRDVLAANFRSTAADGEIKGKGAYIAGAVAEANAAVAPVNVQIHYVKMARVGGAVLAEAREHTCYGLRSRDKVLHRLCYSQHFAETWRKHRRWQLEEARYFPGQSLELDGKPTTKSRIRALIAH